jgi:hypothetical protein
MKTHVIPSGARDLAIAMSASSNHARIDEAKGLQHLRRAFVVYVRSLVVYATRDDTTL